jgi:hypothetical protein
LLCTQLIPTLYSRHSLKYVRQVSLCRLKVAQKSGCRNLQVNRWSQLDFEVPNLNIPISRATQQTTPTLT